MQLTDETDLTIDYRPATLGGFRVIEQEEVTPTHGGRPVRPEPKIEVDGEALRPSPRFWSSLFHRFGLSGNVFRYFDHEEVFRRVTEVSADDRLRLCIERQPKKPGRLLAVSNPKRGVLDFAGSRHLMSRHGGSDLVYSEGVVTSRHTPRSGEIGFEIGGDTMHNRFITEVPIDGFGSPRIFLGMLRQVCANGMIGYSRTFRSDIRLGNDARHTLTRAFNQFDSDEGFAALRQRFESAQKSWASVREVLELRKVLTRTKPRSYDKHTPFVLHLDQMSGDLQSLYGVANLSNLSVKRQRILPSRCRVYDLLNLASEIATHKADAPGGQQLQAFIGTLVSDEFDLEGTAEKVPQFQDLFTNN